jgi:DNA invertase Pin-like site-specific DNA recombinase
VTAKEATMASSQTKLRRAIGYIRVSREGGRSQKNGGDSYRTKEMQQQAIEELARRRGYKIVAWYVDEDESGKDTDRPAFQEALAEVISDPSLEGFLTAKLSRFARSVKDTEETINMLDEHGTALECGDMPELVGPFGKAFRQIMSVFAELELELARESWADALASAVADGIWLRKAPPGYRKNEARKLELDPQVAPLVRDLYLGRAAGDPWSALLSRWQEAGGPKISRSGLQAIIASTTFKGEGKVNGFTLEVPAIVSLEEWDAAQAVKAPRPWRSRQGSLLAGLLVCSSCGGKMTSSGKGGARKAVYRCAGGRAGEARCPNRQTVTQELADAVVVEALLAWAGEALDETGTANGEHGLIAAQQTLEAAQADLLSYAEVSEILDVDTFKAGAAARQAKVDEARAEVARIKGERKVGTVRVTLASLWPDLEQDEKQKLLAKAVEPILVKSGTHIGANTTQERKLEVTSERLHLTFRSDS